jgi:hypothetical protein
VAARRRRDGSRGERSSRRVTRAPCAAGPVGPTLFKVRPRSQRDGVPSISMGAWMQFVLRLAAVVVVAMLGPSFAFADTVTPKSGGSQNADQLDTLYEMSLYVAIMILLLVKRTLIWSLVRCRAPRRPGSRADVRKRGARGGLDERGGAGLGEACRRDLPLPRRHREPAGLRPETGCSLAGPPRLDPAAQRARRAALPADRRHRPAGPFGASTTPATRSSSATTGW